MIYLTRHHEYVRILKQRNSLLKSGDLTSLEPWSDQLAQSGSVIVTHRVKYLGKISHLLNKTYRDISGTKDDAGIAYRAAHTEYSNNVDENAARLTFALSRLLDQERHQRTTLSGPHRDDIVFTLNGKPLRHAASQGQQRCFILALKMAEIEYLRLCYGQTPVLLLDDMTSELDRRRTENLLRFLTERGMQVFITTTSMEQVDGFLNHDRLQTFNVKQGIVQRQT
jgi:DNA replication and repair protein RecF